jgi:actin related protein 2/3 complex subunit 1A/1B
MVAFSPNSNQVHIWKKSGNSYAPFAILKEHDHLVTGIDWGHKTDRIVTCSQDRNAYVWTRDGDSWKPTLVLLRINRAATAVKWSPLENKFAVATGAKCVSICYFEEKHDWWVSKHIKKHRSTVLSISWHPNNVLLATGGTDFKARVFSAFIKGVDEKPSATGWGTKMNFGELMQEFDQSGSWVKDVDWAPSGNRMAFTGHDSSLTVIDVSGGSIEAQTVKFPDLPFQQIKFLSEDQIVGAGHENNPTLFQNSGGWKYVKKLDEPKQAGGKATQSAFDVFKNKVEVGQDTQTSTLATKHQNSINFLQVIKSGDKITGYSTSGTDGLLITWDLPK